MLTILNSVITANIYSVIIATIHSVIPASIHSVIPASIHSVIPAKAGTSLVHTALSYVFFDVLEDPCLRKDDEVGSRMTKWDQG